MAVTKLFEELGRRIAAKQLEEIRGDAEVKYLGMLYRRAPGGFIKRVPDGYVKIMAELVGVTTSKAPVTPGVKQTRRRSMPTATVSFASSWARPSGF